MPRAWFNESGTAHSGQGNCGGPYDRPGREAGDDDLFEACAPLAGSSVYAVLAALAMPLALAGRARRSADGGRPPNYRLGSGVTHKGACGAVAFVSTTAVVDQARWATVNALAGMEKLFVATSEAHLASLIPRARHAPRGAFAGDSSAQLPRVGSDVHVLALVACEWRLAAAPIIAGKCRNRAEGAIGALDAHGCESAKVHGVFAAKTRLCGRRARKSAAFDGATEAIAGGVGVAFAIALVRCALNVLLLKLGARASDLGVAAHDSVLLIPAGGMNRP